jgi:hypothetical protein
VLLALEGVALAAGNSSQTFNIQGVLRDATGALQSMAVGVTVNLYNAQTGGTPFYTKPIPTVPVDSGFFSIELDDPTLTFNGQADVWIGIQIGGDPTELPRQHINAAPYSFICQNAVGDITPNSITVTANATVGGTVSVTGGQISLGSQANQTLSGAQVATLTGGGNADALHTHAGLSHAWIDAGPNDTITHFKALLAQYPGDKYEWGMVYNGDITAAVGVGKFPVPVRISSWNSGVRVMTLEYMEGDGNTATPSGNFFLGGAAWFYGTAATFDDVCTGQDKFLHNYWVWSAGSLVLTGSNGCGGGEWYVRPL